MEIRSIILIVVAVIFAAAIVVATVTVPGTGISIDAPKGWTANTSPPEGTLLILYSKPLEKFKSTISLSAEDLSGKSTQAWMAGYKSGLAAHIDEFKLIKEGEKTIGGAPYSVLEFRGKQGSAMLHWLQAVHFQEGKVWIFSAVTLERQYDLYRRRIQKTYSTIYFPPPPPENFAAQVLSETEIALSWTSHPLAKGGYEIQRRSGPLDTWQTIAKVPAGSSNYNDMNLACGTEMRYRIKCLNPRGDSNWSDDASAVLQICPVETDVPTENP